MRPRRFAARRCDRWCHRTTRSTWLGAVRVRAVQNEQPLYMPLTDSQNVKVPATSPGAPSFESQVDWGVSPWSPAALSRAAGAQLRVAPGREKNAFAWNVWHASHLLVS